MSEEGLYILCGFLLFLASSIFISLSFSFVRLISFPLLNFTSSCSYSYFSLFSSTIMFFSSRFIFPLLVPLAAFCAIVHSTPIQIQSRQANGTGTGVPVSNTEASNVIPNKYIVVYNTNATDAAIQTHQASILSALRKRSLLSRAVHGRGALPVSMDAFAVGAWRGMSLEAEDDMMAEISNSHMVS